MATKRRQTVTKSFVTKKRAEPGIPEHAWESVESGIFFPVAPMKKLWDSLVMVLIIYSVIMVPYRVCFEVEAVGGTWLFEVSVSLAFCADLIVTLTRRTCKETAGLSTAEILPTTICRAGSPSICSLPFRLS